MTQAATISPVGMPPKDWFAELARDWPAADPALINTDDDWRDGALFCINQPIFGAAADLNPIFFNRFEDWASRFVEAIDGSE